MDLLQNPFNILNAGLRDNRQRIMELAEERSLLNDADECMEARSVLTNPRKRLTAEIAWLPGLGPKRTQEVLSLLHYSPADLIGLEGLSSIARVNLIAAGLERLPEHNADDIAEWIFEMAEELDEVDPKELCMMLNEDRVVSGFTEITDLSVIEAEIQERRRYFRDVIKSALDNLSASELVNAVTVAVESSTEFGAEHGPGLIYDLVDAYEVEAQAFLEKEEGNIRSLVEKITNILELKQCPKCGHVQSSYEECESCQIYFQKYIKSHGGDTEIDDTVLAPLVSKLIEVVKNWDTVAQPIQVSTKSRGLGHDASHRVASIVRALALNLFNEHGRLDFSKQITNMLQEVFAEVDKVAERAEEDANALDDIAEQRARLMEDAKNKDGEWRREITYEADIGLLFKDKLRISPEGIEWKGRHWDLDCITRVRWGGTRHSVNGIPTGTTYSIFFGDDSQSTRIELKTETIYTNFIDRLWRAVGVRLLTQYLEGLRDGKQYRFGSMKVSDNGMELEREKLFTSNERVFCQWDELSIWNSPGGFGIGKKDDKKVSKIFSYLDEDNIHILEAAIRMFWQRGGNNLSSILGE